VVTLPNGREELLEGYERFCEQLLVLPEARSARLAGARAFLERNPDLERWIRRALRSRLCDLDRVERAQCFVSWALASGIVRADVELLMARCLPALPGTVAKLYPAELDTLRAAASRLGLREGWTDVVLAEGLPLAVAASARPPNGLGPEDLDALGNALGAMTTLSEYQRRRLGSRLRSLSRILYEAGVSQRPAPPKKRRRVADRLASVTTEAIRASIASYLEVRASVLRPSSIDHLRRSLAMFGEFCSTRFPELTSLASLDRRHVEAYLGYATSRPSRSPIMPGRPLTTASAAHDLITLRNFLDDIAGWGWPDAPNRRLVFSSDVPRPPKFLPRALPPDHDAAVMEAVGGLEDRFARDGLTILRGTGLRIGELLDLELTQLVNYQKNGFWLQVPLGKLNSQRTVPIDGLALSALEDWIAHRQSCRALPAPRDGHLADFVFVEHGQRLAPDRLRSGLHEAVRATGLVGPDGKPLRVVAHQLRHTYATSLVNARLSLQALMALLGHRTPEMTLRYATLSSPTMRRAYEEAMGKLRPRIPVAAAGRPAMGDKVEWLASEMLKTRLAHGYCARELVAEACPYANVCENCANFVTAPEFAPVLESQLADERRLRDDARSRGWTSELARHERVIESLEGHLRRLHP
jgi:integrase